MRSAKQLLAEHLPADAERCVVVAPSEVSRAHRPLVSLVSQVDHLPWALTQEVLAYARAEVTPRGDHRRVIEWLRFQSSDAAAIRADLHAHAQRKLLWDEDPDDCDDVLTCVPVRARFVDPHTVRITTGEWPYGASEGGGACAKLLAEAPHAAEVSARDGLSSVLDARDVERLLLASDAGITRIERRHFRDARSAERAHAQFLMGQQDLPSLAGGPIEPEHRVHGSVLEQTAQLGWEDLLLVVEDQERLRRALGGPSEGLDVPPDQIDAGDVERVRAYVDQRLAELVASAGQKRMPSLRSLGALLDRACGLRPSEPSLARRQYQVALLRGDARRALQVADRMLALKVDDRASWELLSRAALSRLDPDELSKRLMLAHGLPPETAARMARELVQRVRVQHADYERSEWAWLLAHGLSERARAAPLVSVPALPVGLGTAVRGVALLGAALLSNASGPLGVHVVVTGVDPDRTLRALPQDAWVERTDALGQPGFVVAATALRDGQLAAVSRVLDGLGGEGPVSVFIGLHALSDPARRGTFVRLSGSLGEHGFTLESATKNLAYGRWDMLVRHLFAPLERMPGELFPPDELTLDAMSEQELSEALAAASSQDGITCRVAGLELTCRGRLDDTYAAERALTASLRTSLHEEAQRLHSGAE